MDTPTFSEETIQRAYEKFKSTLGADLKSRLNGRLERGLALVQHEGLEPYPDQPRLYCVLGSDITKPPYTVNLATRSCGCADHWKGHFCKHRIAAHIYEIASQLEKAAQKGINLPPTPRQQPVSTVRESEPQALSQVKPMAPSALQSEAIIWAMVKYNDQSLAVEVLSLKDDLAVVRALPAIKDGGKMQPQFPFREGKSSITTFPANDLFHVKVFRKL